MRYPLAFGLITALIAGGIMINFAAENQKQREAKRQQEQHQTYLANYRCVGPIAPVGSPSYLTVRARTPVKSTDSGCCKIESQHSLAAKYDQAGLFRQIGWQKKDKVKSQQELIQISVADARKEVLNPRRFEYATPVRKIQTALWDCGDAIRPNHRWQADLRRAAVTHRSDRVVEPAFTQRPSLDQKLATNIDSVPSDAMQTDVELNLLAIAQANSIRHAELANHPTFQLQSLDFQSLTRSFPKSFGQLTDQLVQNAMPKQENYNGCGSSVVAARVAQKSKPQKSIVASFEDAILAGVCEIHHITPSQIDNNPFHQRSAHVQPVAANAPSQAISTSLSVVASRLFESGQNYGQQFSQVADSVGHWNQQSGQWAESQFSSIAQSVSLPDFSMIEFGNKENNDRSLAEAPLQPIPAANNLGIRAFAQKLHSWFSGETEQALTHTANVSRTIRQWGLQQNAALERMVLQHNDHIQR